MPSPFMDMTTRQFPRELTRRAEAIKTGRDLVGWIHESGSWLAHIVEKEAARQGLTDTEREALSACLVRSFAEIQAAQVAKLHA